MTRDRFLAALVGLLGTPLVAELFGRDGDTQKSSDTRPIAALHKRPEDWRSLVSPTAYRVLFEEATEPPFTSPLNDEKHPGTFICAACYLPLFDARTKFNSGTGWPSFYAALPGRLGTKWDFKMGLPRTEYHCIRCGGHQGHVFGDGPPPTGQRYCNNGVALVFAAAGTALPALRG